MTSKTNYTTQNFKNKQHGPDQKTGGESSCSRMVKQILFLIRHQPCYSLSSSVKVLLVKEERQNLCKKEEIDCQLQNGYFVMVNHFCRYDFNQGQHSLV